MFFEGSVRSTRRISCSVRRSTMVALGRQHLLALRQLLELGRVDRDRMDADERAATLVLCDVVDEVALRVNEIAGRPEEIDPPAIGMERDHVVRQQPVVDRAAHLVRQHVPVVGLRPRDVDEVGEQRVGHSFPHDPRREVEVVIVEEDRRLGLGLELLGDRLREAFVDAHVAVRPGVLERDVDRGRVGQLPEVVLQEPEHRVRDDVVEPVVGRLVVRDQAQPHRGVAAEALLDHALSCHGAVFVAHRARDPGHVVVRDEPAQRRDEPAAAAPGHALAVLARVGDGPAVGDDDQLAAASWPSLGP